MKLLSIIVGFTLFSCTSKEVSWETQEDARRTAKENAEFVARQFKSDHYPNHRMIVRGDSTIGKNCAQGDGWASVDFVDSNSGLIVEAKCSTVSETIGCMTKYDFSKKSYAHEEGSCNDNIPHPLPRLKQ